MAMGALGDVLELAALSAKRWSTLSATVQAYTNFELQQKAIERGQPSFMPKRSRPPGDPSFRSKDHSERTSTAKLWANGTERFRIEENSADPEIVSVTVRNTDSSWTRIGTGAVMVSDHNGPFGMFPDPAGWSRLLDPSSLFENVDVEALGPGAFAGRPTLRVRTVSRTMETSFAMRPARSGPMMFIGWMGDECLIELDADTGLVLKFETSIDGQIFRSFAMSDVAIDGALDATLFDEPPPADAPSRRAEQMAEPVESVAARVDFTLFAPPDACMAFLSDPKSDKPSVVHIHRVPTSPRFGHDGPPAIVHLTESSSAELVADPAEWESIEIDGRPGWIWQPDGGGEVHVRLDREGTHIWLRGLHDRTEALDVARNLVPVEGRESNS
jgi:hypothetical protein